MSGRRGQPRKNRWDRAGLVGRETFGVPPVAAASPDTDNSRPGYDEIPWVYDEERRQRLADTENSDSEAGHG